MLGATHPHLLAREGEDYRLSLERLAESLGVKDNVIFYNRFVSPEDLREFIGATDIYLTPYLNEAADNLGHPSPMCSERGRPSSPTPYWHAQELLAEGRGALVPFRDSEAIAKEVCAYLDDPARLLATRERAYALGRGTNLARHGAPLPRVLRAGERGQERGPARGLRRLDPLRPPLRPASAEARIISCA